jgi:hypothetical protein
MQSFETCIRIKTLFIRRPISYSLKLFYIHLQNNNMSTTPDIEINTLDLIEYCVHMFVSVYYF